MKARLFFLSLSLFLIFSCTTTKNQNETKNQKSKTTAAKNSSTTKSKSQPKKQKTGKYDLYKNIASAKDFCTKNPNGPYIMKDDDTLDSVTLGDWNGESYCFHSLEIGDPISVVDKKLKPDFELAYKLAATTKGLIYTNKRNPNFYLEIDLDDQNCVYLILYKFDYVYSIENSGV